MKSHRDRRRALATRASTPAVLSEIVEILGSQTRMKRVWVALGADDATERVAADSDDGSRAKVAGPLRVPQRMPGDTPAKWLRAHPT
jgi:hypothetical protein